MKLSPFDFQTPENFPPFPLDDFLAGGDSKNKNVPKRGHEETPYAKGRNPWMSGQTVMEEPVPAVLVAGLDGKPGGGNLVVNPFPPPQNTGSSGHPLGTNRLPGISPVFGP